MTDHRLVSRPVAALSHARRADWPSSKYCHTALHLGHDRCAVFLARLGTRMHLGGTPFEAFGAGLEFKFPCALRWDLKEVLAACNNRAWRGQKNDEQKSDTSLKRILCA